MKFLSAVLLLVLSTVSVDIAAAQHPDRSDTDVFREDLRDRVRRVDEQVLFRTRRVGGRRVDLDKGIARAVYEIDDFSPTSRSAREAALEYLSAAKADFGLQAELDLETVSTRSTGVSHHVLFRQTVRGIPVHGRFVKVSLDRYMRPTMILNGIAPDIDVTTLPTSVALTSDEAKAIARAAVAEGDSRVSEPELRVYPSHPPVLVWRLVLWPENVPGEWEVLVDGTTGKVVHLLDQVIHRKNGDQHVPYVRNSSKTVTGSTLVNGTGLVFDPDPLTTSNVFYGPPYSDSGDDDVAELNAERVQVDLLDITQGNDGLYRLEGPYVQITGETRGSSQPNYTPPAVSDPNAFHYTRGQDHFEAVNAYYHIDKSQRYVRSLNFTDLQNAPIRVNPRGTLEDNSRFYPAFNFIEFGIGGVDDAEDAGVIWHEYAHALMEAGAPGLNSTFEGQALHEGWSDYWAGSYLRLLADTQVGWRQDWEKVFRWDSGDGQIWPGRILTRSGVYPDDTTCDDPNDVNGDGCRIHDDGLLWGTSLMEIYSEVGKEVTDKLSLQSHAYLSAPVTFTDAAEALVQADRDLYGGIHTAIIVDKLSARGYLDPEAFGPVVSHSPLRSTEELGSTVKVDVYAVPSGAPVSSVTLYHRLQGESEFSEQLLQSAAGDSFSTDLALPATPSTVEYYVEAVDENSIRSRIPSSAPESLFSFEVGPDTEAPSISHIPITSASSALWPATVVAAVDDNLGVDSVWVDFSIEDADGVIFENGQFGLVLSGSEYRGVFPVDLSQIQAGSVVRYSVTARDAAAAGNIASSPTSGAHSFPIVFTGVLALLDFEGTNGGLIGGGLWQHGTPTHTLRVAHSGQSVWGTTLDGRYPGAGQSSSLEMPPFNLAGLTEAYLIFWHWHDFEYRGSVEPGGPVQGTLWDGGNVKISTDGGVKWTVAQPEDGYMGVLAASPFNPIAGEEAFGGYSFGWRRVIVPLPIAADVRVRFDFGTDESNAEQSIDYAGWFIDDITVSTDRPIDSEAPVVTGVPPSPIVRPVGVALPTVAIQARDNTGISSVFVDYAVVGSEPVTGSLPLAMSLSNLSLFNGFLPTNLTFAAGDRFEYRMRLTDFDGNTTITPESGSDPFVVEYRTVQSTNILAGIVPTGHWNGETGFWRTDPDRETAQVSSLVFPPITLPASVADLWLYVDHDFQLGNGLGGNFSFTIDDGKTWSLIRPVDGYPGRLVLDGHPMNGQDAFVGSSDGPVGSLFDISAYAGREIRFRADFAVNREWDSNEQWRIFTASIEASSLQPTIEIPIELTLNANFPDPFSTTTTISYSIPNPMQVRIDVYNLLGQLVALVANRVHEKGTYTTTFDGSNLAAGVYFLRMDAGGQRRIERMMIAH